MGWWGKLGAFGNDRHPKQGTGRQRMERGSEGVWETPGRAAVGRREQRADPGEHRGESLIEIMIIIKPQPLAIIP